MKCLQRRSAWHNGALVILVAGVLIGLASTSARGTDAETLAQAIDRQILARLATERMQPASPADDAEFFRRVSLDLYGVVPTTERVAQFLESRDRDKRVKLIDELLAGSRFGAHFGNIWRSRLISPLVNEQRQHSERFTSGAGRNHWARAWSAVLAGGGIRGGQVVGRTDGNAAEVVERPISVTDFLGTTCRILGIDYTQENRAPGIERPIPIVDTSKKVNVIAELL